MTRISLHAAMLALLLCTASNTTRALDRSSPPAQPSLPDMTITQWFVHLPDSGPVHVSGITSSDGAGGEPGSMMYPAPNVAGLLAAVMTHGVIESARKRKRSEQIQQTANKVLQPYLTTLSGMSNREVAATALTRRPFGEHKTLAGNPAPQDDGWRISAIPVFSVSQDHRAFVIDNTIALFSPGTKAPFFRTSVHVVSMPRQEQDPTSAWIADKGAALREEWGFLFAESIEVALRAVPLLASDAASVPFATVRYMEGDSEKIERAQPLYKTCGRLVLKTLRGKLMSVPVRPAPNPDTDDMTCSDAP